MRTSYSNLDTFRSCPLKYKYREIDKIRGLKSVELVFGSCVHSSLKYLFERTPLYPTLDQVVDFFRNIWADKKTSIAFKDKDAANAEEILKEKEKEGVTLIEKFYKKNQPWNFNAVDLESHFEVLLVDPEQKKEHTLAGKIDRIDKIDSEDVYEIIDYKTSKKMPGQKEVDNDLQLSVYHLALRDRWPHVSPEKIKLSLYYLKHGEKISTLRDEEQLQKTKKNILNSINDIEKRIENNYDFPPYPSGLCDYCDYREICPMWRHLYERKYGAKSQEEINAVVSQYFDLKNKNEENKDKMDELKAIVSGFMDEQKVERVFGDLGYITRKTQERISYDMKKIKKLLESLGKWTSDLFSKKQITTLTASKKKIKE